MLKHRFLVSFFSTAFLYALLVFLIFYVANTYIGSEEKPKDKIITLSMSEFIPEILPPVEEKELPIKEPEPVEEPPVEPIEEIKPEEHIEEVVPEPIVEKTVLTPTVKKVVKKKIIKNKPVKKIRKKIVKKRIHKKVSKKKSRKSKKKSSRSKVSPVKKNRYLSQIRAKINRSKSYPRIAQRRGMQGKVKVRFTILANGHVSNIQVTGKKVFLKSARQAVKKAFPISTKNIPITLPLTVNFTLKYHLR